MFPAPHQATTSFQPSSLRKFPTPYPKDNPGEVIETHQEQVYEVSQDRIIFLSPYSPVLLHFPRVPTKLLGQVTFNTWRYNFVNSPGNAIDLSYLIYHKHHNKCYFFTDTGKLNSAPLSTFPFKTKFVICKDRHLHITKHKLEVSEHESLHNGRDTPNIRYANESKGKIHSRQCKTNRQEVKASDSKGWKVEEEDDDLGLSLSAAKTFDQF